VRLSRKTPSKTVFRRFSSGPNGETRTQEYKLFFEDASLAMQFMLMVNQLKEAKRDADKIIFDLDNADRLEKMGRIDEATALKEKAADNAQKLNQNLLQYQTSIEGDKSRSTSAEKVANIQAQSQKTTAQITADRMATSARESALLSNRRLDENERKNLQGSVLIAERALADTEKAIAAEKDKDFAYKDAKSQASQTRGVTPTQRAAAQAEVTAKDAAWNTRITRAREDADFLKSQMREVNARLGAGSASPSSANAESVKVGENTYSRPAGMTDAQWSDYKKSQGVK
jgi:hypothetical protein